MYTDHKNLTYAGTQFNSDRRIHQRIFIEEYGAELMFVAGDKDVVVDEMSWLDFEKKWHERTVLPT